MGLVLGALGLLAGLVGAGLHAANEAAGRTVEPSFWLMGVAASVGYGAAAVMLRGTDAARVRGLVGAVALTQGLSALLSEWAMLGPDVWLHDWTLWLGSWLWAPGYAAVAVLLPLVLPEGRLPSPRWAPALWLSVVALVGSSAAWALTPYDAQDFPEAFGGAENPVGVEWVGTSPVWDVTGVLGIAAAVAALSALVVRWRRSRDVERQQLKWVLLGYVATLVLFVVGRLMPVEVTGVVAGLAMLPLPLAIGVAVLRHGLWEVDLVISRALVYASLSAVVVGVYAVTVWLLADLLGATTGGPVLATTLVALLALPARAWLQRHVNRLVHGDPEEPYAVLARLGDQLGSATAPDDLAARVLPSVVEQVARSLRAREATLTLRDGTVTSYGDGGPGVEVAVDLVHAGEPLGSLAVRRPAGFDESTVRALHRLAGQAAVAAHTVLLSREAQRSREAVVRAREEERRRLRRDLHDGIGPSLAAIALHAETARDLADEDAEAAVRVLDRLVPRLNATVADVRALVHELRPPMLDELGLAAAVEELADRLSTARTAVTPRVGALPALPAAVEVAAYHVAGEALGNAVRHAAASRVVVELAVVDGALEVVVEDDGHGFGPDPRPGLGTTSMRERAEELGGGCTVTTGPAGTRVRAVWPLTGRPDAVPPVVVPVGAS